MTNYISHSDTNKLIRRALKEAFPGVKFSVRGSNGSATWVEWQDGPSARSVDNLLRPFCGANFDGMTDYKSYNRAVMNDEICSFGVDFIFTRRELSPAHLTRFAAEWQSLPADTKCEIMIKTAGFSNHGSDARAYAHLCGTPAKPSPTAEGVTFLSAD